MSPLPSEAPWRVRPKILEHLNLFSLRETLSAQQQSDMKETETAAQERGQVTRWDDF